MAADAFIQCRVAPATKAALCEAAHRQQLSESALLRRMLLVLLPATAVGEPMMAMDAPRAERIQRRARLSVRLTGEDQRLLIERAAARRLAPASYVSALIRSHLRTVTPIPLAELRELRSASAELAAIGRNINQIARAVQSGSVPAEMRLSDLGTFLKLCQTLHAHFQHYIRSNAASWTSGHAPPSAQP